MRAPNLGARYEYLRRLGRGGAGEVFLARDTAHDRLVSFKRIDCRSFDAETLDQFRKEFRVLAAIEHPGIARARDFGFVEDRPYFTYDFVEGAPLGDRDGLLPPDTEALLDLLRELADALAFLHQGGLVHLDVKPGNIILRPGPEGHAVRATPVLIDFGLFRRGFHSISSPQIRGSLPYLAPEHFRGEPLGPWTDVYALGVTIYRHIAGEFPGPLPRWGRDGIVPPPFSPPRPLSRSSLEAGGEIEAILLKCLATDPEARYPSAVELRDHLCALRERSSNQHSSGKLVRCVPLVETFGRSQELEAAKEFLDAAALRRGDDFVLVVTGPRGSGLTHFLRELRSIAQTQGLPFELHSFYPNEWKAPGSLFDRAGDFISESDPDAGVKWRAFLTESRRAKRIWQSQRFEEEPRAAAVAALSDLLRGIRRPCVLAADGLQFADPASLALLKELARLLQRLDPAARPPLCLVLGYREEGPSLALVRDLSASLLSAAGTRVLAIRSLVPTECLALYHAMGGREADGRDALMLYQETGGFPARIAAAVVGKGCGVGHARPTESPAPILAGTANALAKRCDRVVLALAVLRRPAAAKELAALSGAERDAALGALADLEVRGLAISHEDEHGAATWLAGPALSEGGRVAGAKAQRAVRSMRLKVARSAKKRGSREPMALLEALEQFEAAGDQRGAVECGMRLARYLQATHQSKAALGVYRRVLAVLPRGATRERVEATIAAGELHAVVGDVDDGIQSLRHLLSALPKDSVLARARVLACLAVLLARRGDHRRADALFAKVLGRRERDVLTAPEALRILNEHAAVKAILGDLEGTERLCAEALARAKGKRDARTREVVLNLRATLGSVALRRHEYDRAAREFDAAATMAEYLGARASQAIILNNLGTALSQSDRFQEASRAYSDAERVCIALGATPTLASIRGNAAILHAKLGELAKMVESLEALARMDASTIGRRGELLREHAFGLCALYRGRFFEARARFDKALPLARSLGDAHVARADEVYRAECLIFEGRYGEADAELSRLCAEPSPPSTRVAALARRAFLLALLGVDHPDAFRAAHQAIDAGPDVPFLRAWDRLYLAWSRVLTGAWSEADVLLAPATSYFRSSGLKPAASLAACIRAESLLLAGKADHAFRVLDGVDDASDLVEALRPLVAARVWLERGPSDTAMTHSSDLLATVGASMTGNPLHEWGLRARALREAILGASRTSLEELRRLEVENVPEAFREAYVRAPSWIAWIDGALEKVASLAGASGSPPRSRCRAKPSARTAAFALAGRPSHALIARSPAMRALVAAIEKLEGSGVPVLIIGETGTGKGLVVRVLHDKSPRRFGPFRVVDCGSIPTTMFEAELFGVKAGSFTDADVDRPGLLASAGGGTVVFDEIAALPLELQGKLLRVLGEKMIRPLGAEEETRIDVRFLFTSSKELMEEVKGGRFREDLYHRINVYALRVPSLRERLEDFPELVRGILVEGGRDRAFVSPRIFRRLRSRAWAGNVRELRNLIQRVCLEDPEGITLEALDRCLEPASRPGVFSQDLLAAEPLSVLQERLEREYILCHFRRLGGSTERLCDYLGLSSRQLYRKCVRLGIKLRSERRGLPQD